jgi:hypothetical protein
MAGWSLLLEEGLGVEFKLSDDDGSRNATVPDKTSNINTHPLSAALRVKKAARSANCLERGPDTLLGRIKIAKDPGEQLEPELLSLLPYRADQKSSQGERKSQEVMPKDCANFRGLDKIRGPRTSDDNNSKDLHKDWIRQHTIHSDDEDAGPLSDNVSKWGVTSIYIASNV